MKWEGWAKEGWVSERRVEKGWGKEVWVRRRGSGEGGGGGGRRGKRRDTSKTRVNIDALITIRRSVLCRHLTQGGEGGKREGRGKGRARDGE